MKDEEMAEEIANKKLCATIMCYNHCDFNSPEPHKCGDWHKCYECALAGLKAGRPQWHKVADGDLPLVSDSTLLPQLYPVIVAVCVNNNIEVYGTYWDRHRGNFDCLDKVIAWCELPTFDKE